MKIIKEKLAVVIFISLFIGNWNLLKASTPEELFQQNFTEPLVTIKPITSDKPVVPGDSFIFDLELIIAPGFHINSHKPEDEMLVPTVIEFKPDRSFEIKEITYPEAKKKKFMFSEKPLSVYEGQIKVKIKITLDKNYKAKNLPLEGKVHYQACNDYACLRPETIPFKVNITVATN